MNYILPVLTATLEVFIANMFFKKFGERRFSYTIHILICVLYVILQAANSIFLSQTPFVFIGAILITIGFCSAFKIKCFARIVISFIFSIIMALSEAVTVMLVTIGIKIDVAEIQSITPIYLVVILLSKFLPYVVFRFYKAQKTDGLTPRFFFMISLLPLSSVFIIVLLFECAFVISSSIFRIFVLFASVLLMVSNIIIFYIVDKQAELVLTKEKLNFAREQVKYQTIHYNELYNQQQSLKKFKHDSKNFYIALTSLIKTMPPDEAIKQLDGKMNVIFDESNAFDSGNPIIDAIISSKINSAKNLDIKIDAKIRITTKLQIDELDLAVLMGNAIDNAIEAVNKINKGEKIIKISLITIEDMLSFNIINPLTCKIDTSKLTTTKSDKSNHGYGIKGIKAITEKYNGTLKIICENDEFSLSAMLVNI